MAKKKKENTLSYLQMPLPSGGKYSRMTKVAFGGLNKRYTHDSGSMSMEKNISTSEYPYLTPSQSRDLLFEAYPNSIGMFGFDDFLLVIYRKSKIIYVDYITYNADEDDYITYTGRLQDGGMTDDDENPRCVVQFNVYDTPTDPLTGQYVKKLLFFPDKASMYMKIVEAESDPEDWEEDYNKAKAAGEDTTDTALACADLTVMYHYGSYFYVVIVEKNTDADGKVTYERKVKCKSYDSDDDKIDDTFFCDSLSVDIKEYRNETPEVDESGATIYPPPDTASHNCYYRNSYNNDIYRWCEYETAKKNDDGEFVKDDNGNYISDGGTAYGWKVSVPPTMPSLKYATVHLSRVFGVDDDRVYASGYNDYTNWNLDTIDEYNEANAWCSPSQSNTKAGGAFTGITTFQGHVVCFKRDFMHEIYNTKNPFRLTDIYAEGTIDNRTIQDVDGKLIFVSEDDVKIYTGSNPRIIGYNLNMPRYKYAVSGTDNRNYYLYCEDGMSNHCLYVYDTYTELWSQQSVESKVLSFAHNKNGMYMLCDGGYIYKMDTDSYSQHWSFETDIITSKTVNIKHIKRLQMLVDMPKRINYYDNQNAYMNVYILYDNEEFNFLTSNEKAKRLAYSSDRLGKLPIRVKPRNTANYGFKLHFEGYGYVKLYELEIFVEAGGDLIV